MEDSKVSAFDGRMKMQKAVSFFMAEKYFMRQSGE
jgi:hypothetical protein